MLEIPIEPVGFMRDLELWNFVTLQPSEISTQRSASCVKQGRIRKPGRQEFRKTFFLLSWLPDYFISSIG
jgi:hypothetical protein